MAIDFYWGSGSPACWRVALALEFKGLKYNSHLLHFDRQEHKSPQMLAMNFRGKLPVLRDNNYVVFESLAIVHYLDQKYPAPPIFGRNPEEAGVIMRAERLSLPKERAGFTTREPLTNQLNFGLEGPIEI